MKTRNLIQAGIASAIACVAVGVAEAQPVSALGSMQEETLRALDLKGAPVDRSTQDRTADWKSLYDMGKPTGLVEIEVEKGDQLGSILNKRGLRYDKDLEEILKALNPQLSDPNKLRVRQKLRIVDFLDQQASNDQFALQAKVERLKIAEAFSSIETINTRTFSDKSAELRTQFGSALRELKQIDEGQQFTDAGLLEQKASILNSFAKRFDNVGTVDAGLYIGEMKTLNQGLRKVDEWSKPARLTISISPSAAGGLTACMVEHATAGLTARTSVAYFSGQAIEVTKKDLDVWITRNHVDLSEKAGRDPMIRKYQLMSGEFLLPRVLNGSCAP